MREIVIKVRSEADLADLQKWIDLQEKAVKQGKEISAAKAPESLVNPEDIKNLEQLISLKERLAELDKAAFNVPGELPPLPAQPPVPPQQIVQPVTPVPVEPPIHITDTSVPTTKPRDIPEVGPQLDVVCPPGYHWDAASRSCVSNDEYVPSQKEISASTQRLKELQKEHDEIVREFERGPAKEGKGPQAAPAGKIAALDNEEDAAAMEKAIDAQTRLVEKLHEKVVVQRETKDPELKAEQDKETKAWADEAAKLEEMTERLKKYNETKRELHPEVQAALEKKAAEPEKAPWEEREAREPKQAEPYSIKDDTEAEATAKRIEALQRQAEQMRINISLQKESNDPEVISKQDGEKQKLQETTETLGELNRRLEEYKQGLEDAKEPAVANNVETEKFVAHSREELQALIRLAPALERQIADLRSLRDAIAQAGGNTDILDTRIRTLEAALRDNKYAIDNSDISTRKHGMSMHALHAATFELTREIPGLTHVMSMMMYGMTASTLGIFAAATAVGKLIESYKELKKFLDELPQTWEGNAEALKKIQDEFRRSSLEADAFARSLQRIKDAQKEHAQETENKHAEDVRKARRDAQEDFEAQRLKLEIEKINASGMAAPAKEAAIKEANERYEDEKLKRDFKDAQDRVAALEKEKAEADKKLAEIQPQVAAAQQTAAEKQKESAAGTATIADIKRSQEKDKADFEKYSNKDQYSGQMSFGISGALDFGGERQRKIEALEDAVRVATEKDAHATVDDIRQQYVRTAKKLNLRGSMLLDNEDDQPLEAGKQISRQTNKIYGPNTTVIMAAMAAYNAKQNLDQERTKLNTEEPLQIQRENAAKTAEEQRQHLEGLATEYQTTSATKGTEIKNQQELENIKANAEIQDLFMKRLLALYDERAKHAKEMLDLVTKGNAADKEHIANLQKQIDAENQVITVKEHEKIPRIDLFAPVAAQAQEAAIAQRQAQITQAEQQRDKYAAAYDNMSREGAFEAWRKKFSTDTPEADARASFERERAEDRKKMEAAEKQINDLQFQIDNIKSIGKPTEPREVTAAQDAYERAKHEFATSGTVAARVNAEALLGDGLSSKDLERHLKEVNNDLIAHNEQNEIGKGKFVTDTRKGKTVEFEMKDMQSVIDAMKLLEAVRDAYAEKEKVEKHYQAGVDAQGTHVGITKDVPKTPTLEPGTSETVLPPNNPNANLGTVIKGSEQDVAREKLHSDIVQQQEKYNKEFVDTINDLAAAYKAGTLSAKETFQTLSAAQIKDFGDMMATVQKTLEEQRKALKREIDDVATKSKNQR